MLKSKISNYKNDFQLQDGRLFKTTVSLFIAFSFFISGFSQITNPQTLLPNVFPVNPKAAEFIKYTEVPIGKYTGVPNVTVPIYTISLNGLDIPITLSYHSNGIKVNEEAGWTGLGWALNAGGSITQVVNGFDDFGWYRHRDNELQGMINACNVPSTAFDNGGAVDFYLINFANKIGFGLDGPQHSFNWNNALTEGLKDIRQDVFKFNVLGYSGEFVLDWQNESFECISDKNIRIEPINYYNNPAQAENVQPYQFKITTPDGNQFLFTLKEESLISGVVYYSASTYPQLEHLIGSKSSRVYQLTTIIGIGGDVVTFNYIQTSVVENLPAVSLSLTYQEGAQGVHPIPFTNNPASTTVNYSRQSLAYLSSIDFPNGKLVFNSTDDRIDFIGMRKLNTVILQDGSNTTIKNFDFSYDYFVGHTLGSNTDSYLDAQSPVYHTGKVASELTHRLKLLSIKESDKPAYLFEYGQEQLPKKTSLAIDNWGLYNGKHNNVSLMPNISMMGLVDINQVGIRNNRNSTLIGSKAAVLNKITYPTGGTSTFEYELNSFENFRVPDDEHSTVSSVFLNDRNNSGNTPGQIFSSDVTSALYDGTFAINTYGAMSNQTNGLSAYIRLTVLKKTPQNVNATNAIASFWASYNSVPLGQLGSILNDVVTDTRILQFNFDNNSQSYETFKLAENQFLSLDPANIYIIQAYLDDNFGPQTNSSQGAGASVYFTYLKNTSHSVSYGAGIRIKNIQTQDPLSLPLIKSYEYSGGKLMSPLLYLTNSTSEFFSHNGNVNSVPIYKTEIGSSSFLPLSTNASGRYIGYDSVTEINSRLDASNNIVNDNGKIVDYYTNNPDKGSLNSIINADPSLFNGTEAYIPFASPRTYLNYIAPPQRERIQNGLTMANRVYDNNQTLIEETKNEWDYVMPSNHVYSRVSTLHLRSDPEPISGSIRLWYRVAFYPILSPKTILSSTKKTIYSGSTQIVNLKTNSYDAHDQISQTTETDSKNRNIITSFTYPYDIAGYFLTMVYSSNLITPVIEKKVQLSVGGTSKLLSLLRNDFNQAGGGAIGPITYLKSKTSMAREGAPLEDEVIYDLYSVTNTPNRYKLLQYHDKSGVITSIFWGYNGQYPVAKVVGVDYNTAQSYISQGILDNANSSTEAVLRSELNNLRNIPNCLVTTYTYKPLVGMTSETDPSNKTLYYQYDARNRLSVIRDQDNKILKKYDYKYASE